jgi:hyperosmotically inducible periplasmic protein
MKHIKTFLILAIAVLGFSSLNVQAQNYIVAGSAPQSAIEKKIFKEINMLPYYGLYDSISFKVEGGTVTLYGKVHHASNKGSAARVVKRIQGVERVVNNIEILPLSSFDDSIRYQVAQNLANTGGLYRYLHPVNPSVRIIVDRGHVTLEGYVGNRHDYNLMNIMALSASNAFSVKNNLVIESEVNH